MKMPQHILFIPSNSKRTIKKYFKKYPKTDKSRTLFAVGERKNKLEELLDLKSVCVEISKGS